MLILPAVHIMQESDKYQVQKALSGIDIRDPDAIQFLHGLYPEFIGLQTRLGGKTIQEKFNDPVSGIYTFYNYFGRAFRFYEFDGTITITDVDPEQPPIEWNPLPDVVDTLIYDTFEDYDLGYDVPFFPLGHWNTPGFYGHLHSFDDYCYDDFESYALGAKAGDFEAGYARSDIKWRLDWDREDMTQNYPI